MNNPKSRQQWIYETLLERPEFTFSEMFSKYSAKFSKSEKTFSKDWSVAKSQLEKYQAKVNDEKEKISVSEDAKSVLIGIETKKDRVQRLQKQIVEIEKELNTGTHEEAIKVGEKVVKYQRLLTPNEKARARSNIQQLQAEVSKIEGDYAPKKIDHTTKGESLNATMDISKLTPEESEILEKLYEKIYK